MGTDECTLSALDAVLRQPFWYGNSDVSFLILSGCRGPGSVCRYLGNFQFGSFTFNDLCGYFFYEVSGMFGYSRRHLVAINFVTERHLYNVFDCTINGIVVHLHNLITFFAVGLFDGVFDCVNSFFLGQDA